MHDRAQLGQRQLGNPISRRLTSGLFLCLLTLSRDRHFEVAAQCDQLLAQRVQLNLQRAQACAECTICTLGGTCGVFKSLAGENPPLNQTLLPALTDPKICGTN